MKKEPIMWNGRVEKVSFPNNALVKPVEKKDRDEDLLSTGSSSMNASKDASENVSKNVAEDASENVSKNASEDASENVSKNVAEDASENVSKNVAEDASENVSKNASEDASENVSMEEKQNQNEEFSEKQENSSKSESERTIRPAHVKDVLPGQILEIIQTHHQVRRKEGHVNRVVERAPYEIEAKCPHAAECGGCSYQTVPYDLQLEWKENMVRELLTPVLQDAEKEEFLPILQSPCTSAYRNKMEFTFGDAWKGGPLTLGLHKKGAYHDIVNIDGCSIIHEDMEKIVACVQAYFREKEIPFYQTRNHEGYLRHLVLRRSAADGSLLVNLVTTSVQNSFSVDKEKSLKPGTEEETLAVAENSLRPGTEEETLAVAENSAPDRETQEQILLRGFVEACLSLKLEGRISGILHTINDTLSDIVQADAMEVLYGIETLQEELLGLQFELSPFSFFQTNSKGAEVLYQCIIDFARESGSLKTAFDLYCGTGTIAQLMAHAGAEKVLGIELIEEAVCAAKENAKKNHLAKVDFFAGDVLKLVDTLKVHPDLIVLDPPRDGIHPKAMPKILAYKPDHFIYVSCKPTALVRDIPCFREAGYRVEKLRCVDMFPQTYHVETVVLMSKVK